MDQTLVLDISWRPVSKIPWERAVTLLWEKKVETIVPYEGRTLHSASWDIPMPAVIRFFRATRKKKKAIKFSRESLLIRDHFTCQYCGKTVARNEATYDHVVPRVAGGVTNFFNILISCVSCNQRKGGRTPQEANMKIVPCKIKNCPYHSGDHPIKPKSLPDHLHIAFEWRVGYPEEWRQFLRDAVVTHQYWNGSLDED